MEKGTSLLQALLRNFGIDPQTKYAAVFIDFVRRLADYRRQNPNAQYGAGAVLRALAVERKEFYLMLDQAMKRAVSPVLEASSDRLDQYALRPAKRTVCSLAWEMAEYFLLDE